MSSPDSPGSPYSRPYRPPFPARLAYARAAVRNANHIHPEPGDPRFDQHDAAVNEACLEVVGTLAHVEGPTLFVGGDNERFRELTARVVAGMMGCRTCDHIGRTFSWIGGFPVAVELTIRWVGCRDCLARLDPDQPIVPANECDWCDRDDLDPQALRLATVQVDRVVACGYACPDCCAALGGGG